MIMNEYNRLYEAPQDKKSADKSAAYQITSFTEDSYKRFLKKMGNDDSGNSYGEMLIEKLIDEKYVFEDGRYEKCYRCNKDNRKIKKKLNDINKGKEQSQILFPYYKGDIRKIPWGDIDRMFLPKTLNPSKGSFENA